MGFVVDVNQVAKIIGKVGAKDKPDKLHYLRRVEARQSDALDCGPQSLFVIVHIWSTAKQVGRQGTYGNVRMHAVPEVPPIVLPATFAGGVRPKKGGAWKTKSVCLYRREGAGTRHLPKVREIGLFWRWARGRYLPKVPWWPGHVPVQAANGGLPLPPWLPSFFRYLPIHTSPIAGHLNGLQKTTHHRARISSSLSNLTIQHSRFLNCPPFLSRYFRSISKCNQIAPSRTLPTTSSRLLDSRPPSCAYSTP